MKMLNLFRFPIYVLGLTLFNLAIVLMCLGGVKNEVIEEIMRWN